MSRNNLHLFWRNRSCLERFRAGVSLHSHTLHSQESLAFIPRYTAFVPILGDAIRHQERRYQECTGRALDFGRAFWRPPLGPREALDLEAHQIENILDMDAMVSLSDHDNIDAGAMLAVIEPGVPVSVEWTIPFGRSFFHVGIHNLPLSHAREIMADLAATRAKPERDRIRASFASLNDLPETLIVWNHPCWDEARIGSLEHARLLGQFLERFGEFIHALELNGLRPWSENRHVLEIAGHSGHPVVSGGDRHGLEPNANVNLTNAGTFAEFVEEIRIDRHSDVLFLPQYREPLRLRMVETMRDVVREYPEFPAERRRWCDRVFYQQSDGVTRPLSDFWKGNEPWLVQWFLKGLHATRSSQLRGALRLALSER
jgi:hypothetical protein